MRDFRQIFFILGILLTTLAIAMLVPTIIDLANDNHDWQVFISSAGFTLFVGILFILTTRSKFKSLSIRQAFLLTTMSWVILPIFAALPFTFSELDLDYTDAFFESMSGITTTGSTVITGLDTAPPGILLWRSLLQWLGGIGIIVMALSILPMLQVGGMQLFKMEFAERVEKALPRATQMGAWIAIIYLILTIICATLYWMVGMNGFDAINHAMTTVATGGYSTHDDSMGLFDNTGVDIIATIFMILGSLPFLLYLQAIHSSIRPLLKDSQVRWFISILSIAIIFVIVNLMLKNDWNFWMALRYASFNVTSVMTGTGYATADYGQWGSFSIIMFYLLMFIGGCAGSTTCGLKIFRIQVLYETARRQLRRLLQPNGVFIAYYNGKSIPYSVADSVMSFFFLFAVIFCLLAAALGMLGLDFITATSGAGAALANVGPGLGPIIGPSGNFSSLPDAAKWVMSFGMLLGRLEIFTVLVLFSRHFWQD